MLQWGFTLYILPLLLFLFFLNSILIIAFPYLFYINLSIYLFSFQLCFTFSFSLGAVLCSQGRFFPRTRSWKAIHGFFNETLLHLFASVCVNVRDGERETKKEKWREGKVLRGLCYSTICMQISSDFGKLWSNTQTSLSLAVLPPSHPLLPPCPLCVLQLL